MKEQALPARVGKKLSRTELRKIKGGTAFACTIEQQEACTGLCITSCGPEAYCDRFCRCICV